MAKYVQQKTRIKIPKGYSPSQRQDIGKEIVQFIRERTKADSKDKQNQKFAGYSPEYKKEKGSSKVNLKMAVELFTISIGVGVISGAAINISLGYKAHDKGGLLGGLVVGLLMAIL